MSQPRPSKMDRCLTILERLLPGASKTYGNNWNHNVSQECNLVSILSNYFNNKRIPIIKNIIEVEARYIHKLFPSIERKYIFQQLNLFKDMPHRKEIVIRLIVQCYLDEKMGKSLKRNGQFAQLPNQDLNPNKMRKVIISDVTDNCQQPSTNDQYSCVVKSSYTPSSTHIPASADNNTFTPEFINSTESSADNNTVTSEFVNSTEFLVSIACDLKVGGSESHASYTNNNEINLEQTVNVDVESEVSIPQSDRINLSQSIVNEFKSNPKMDFIKNRLCIMEPKPTINETKYTVAPLSSLDDAENYTLDYLNATLNMSEDMQNPARAVLCTSDGKPSTVTSSSKNVLEEAILEKMNFDIDSFNIPNNNNEYSTSTVAADLSLVPKFGSERPPPAEVKEIEYPVCMENAIEVTENKPCDEPVPTPSTNTAEEREENFNLIEYLRDITNAPVNVIKRCCQDHIKTPFNVRPSVEVIQIMVDRLFENPVVLEDSDDSLVEFVDASETPAASDEKLLEPPTNTKCSISSAISTASYHVLPSQKPSDKRHITSSKLLGNACVEKKPVKRRRNSYSTPNIETIVEETEKILIANSVLDVDGLKTGENSDNAEGIYVNQQLVTYLCGVFPDASPAYIRALCAGKQMNNEVVDILTSQILNLDNQYPKRQPPTPEPEVFPENQLEILKEFLPDADPDYLQMTCDSFHGNPELVKKFLNKAMEERDYPTMKEYQRRQQLSAQQKQYTSEFSVENFIKVIPDPKTFFSDKARNVKLSAADSHYALVFLRNKFNKLPVRTIQHTFTKRNGNLFSTVKDLKKLCNVPSALMRSVRKRLEPQTNIQNIPLLQEIAYLNHEKEIFAYLEQIKDKEEAEKQEARSKGLLKSCSCCYDEEVMARDIFCCENGCEFCKACIIKATEVRFGDGKLDFPCLMNCEAEFNLQTLQTILSPKLFSKIAQKKTLEEVKAAGIAELEFCPFCDFATIPAEGYTIFSCLNPDCMKESCRSCKEPSHIPLRCDEIEKDEDVAARTYVENKMTEALLRKCWKCGVKFFKEEGCNKMTCSCGAHMCYLCGQPVKDYTHFNGNGGDRFDLCPLYSDTNVFNKENVLKGAQEAKKEIDLKNLKYDPTEDVENHYKKKKTSNVLDFHEPIAGRGPNFFIQNVLLHDGIQAADVAALRGRAHELQRHLHDLVRHYHHDHAPH